MGPQKRVVFFIFFSLLSLSCRAQDEWNIPWITLGDSLDLDENSKLIITGKIVNRSTNEPVIGASISVETFKYFDFSDRTGSYVLELPPGSYKIKVKHVGMLPVYIKAHLLSNNALNIDMYEGSIELNEIVITSRAIDSNVKASLTGLTKLNIQEIKTLPALLGEVDIIKSLQLMPGVTSVGEGTAGFNVRGGRVDQNLVLLNDVPIFNTNHALGFVSSFNQDIVRDFGLYKGNVPANFGGRASSVLEINSRRGDFDQWKFSGGVGPITSRFGAEGPLVKGKTSLLMTGRVAHVGWALNKVKDPNVKNSKTSFYDGYVGVSHRFSENSTADITLYSSHDDFRFSDKFGYAWNNSVVSAKWQALANRKASPVINIAYGHFKSSLIDPSGIDASQLTNTLNYLQFKTSVNYIPTDHHTIVAGASAIAYMPRPETQKGYNGNTAIASKEVNKDQGLEVSLFANDEYELSDQISISAGLRYSRYLQLGRDTIFQYESGLSRSPVTIQDTLFYGTNETIKSYDGLEPRVSARISITPHQSFKIGYNRMRQYIHLVSNTTAPTPIDLWQVSNSFLPPQTADNYSVGYFLNLKDNRWETSAEVFYKDMKNIVEYKDFPQLYVNRHLETELLSGIGRAYGAEMFVRKLKGIWTGWVSYTYSQTKIRVSSPIKEESINDGRWYPSNYNKPHNFNIVINRVLKSNGAFSAILVYNTGRPFTGIESSYVVGTTVVPIYSERNKYHIPNYFRLDLSLTIGNVFKKVDDSLVLSFYNFLGRNNAYSIFYTRPAPNYKIPKPYKLSVLGAMLPSLVYTFKF